MIDGVDGLCASLALLPLLVVGRAGVAGRVIPRPMCSLTATTALAVFLAFNLGRDTRWLPKLFLGDSGSGMLGFAVCAVLVYFSQPPQMLLKPVDLSVAGGGAADGHAGHDGDPRCAKGTTPCTPIAATCTTC